MSFEKIFLFVWIFR